MARPEGRSTHEPTTGLPGRASQKSPIDGPPGDDTPTESISLAFSKFEFDYSIVSNDGIPGPAAIATWDLAKNKGA